MPKPAHPLISLINGANNAGDESKMSGTYVLGFYKLSYRPRLSGKLQYGQHYYDFEEGGLLFASPNQFIGSNKNEDNIAAALIYTAHSSWFFTELSTGKKIKGYGFFSYSTNEALHLSDKEKDTIITISKIIEEEVNSRIDDFSQDVIVSQIELLLNYANRFYKRQFITRKAVNKTILEQLEEITDNYFNSETFLRQGLPTVQYLAKQLHFSPSYLSDMLRSLIGQNAQQYIHGKLVEKAKENLSATNLSVSEIAYELGFEHPQSFSKLFRKKTQMSPLEFRQAFN